MPEDFFIFLPPPSMESFSEIILWILAFSLSVSVHESAHALSAYLLGDPTGKYQGRISLNPFKHLDLLGLLFLIFAHFGWARPVPVDPRNFKHPRFHMALVAAAGPISNLLLALASLNLIELFSTFSLELLYFLKIFALLNVLLAVFNLIPLHPLDGEKILALLIPRSLRRSYKEFAAHGPLILFGLMGISAIFHLNILSYLIVPAAEWIMTGLQFLVFF